MSFRQILTVFIFVCLSSAVWAIDQTHDFADLPITSVLPSSALVNDSSSLLLNPAMLARMDRMNMIFSFGSHLSINYLSLGMLIPNAGAIAGGLFHFSGIGNGSEGIILGWGSDISPFFSMGTSLYTVSDNYTRYDDGILLNVGVLLTFNRSLGDAFDSDWINNRLTFSFVLQNFGKQPTSVSNTEAFSPRIGFAYKMPVFPINLFLELLPATPKQVFFGAEIQDPFFDLVNLRISSDTVHTHLGGSLKTRDFSLDLSYEFKDAKFNVGFSAYFDIDRKIQSKTLFSVGTNYFNQAVLYEKDNQEITIGKVFENYNLALDSFQKSHFYNPENVQSLEQEDLIHSKLTSLRSNFIAQGQKSESKNRTVSALVYYQRAALIENNANLQKKIDLLSIDSNVLEFINVRKQSINEYTNKQDYISAKQEWVKLSWVFPKKPEILKAIHQTEIKIAKQAKTLYKQAEQYFRRKQYSKTVKLLNQTIAIFDKAQAIPQNDTYEKAIYLSYQVRKKTRVSKYINAAQTSYNQKNYLTALSQVNQVLRRNENLSAVSLKNKILKALSQSASQHYQAGVTAYNNGNYQKALDEFKFLFVIENPSSNVRDFQNRAKDYSKRAESKLRAIKQLESIGQ